MRGVYKPAKKLHHMDEICITFVTPLTYFWLVDTSTGLHTTKK